MRKTEALALLNQYAPDVTTPKTRLPDFVCDLIKERGHQIGLDLRTGDWIIVDKNDNELARSA